MAVFDAARNGAGDSLVFLPDGQPWLYAGQYDIWLSQATADYSSVERGVVGLRPDLALEPGVGLMPDSTNL